jgi:2,3-bisphosphoglycerate-dependent phosphoglycerate mutase
MKQRVNTTQPNPAGPRQTRQVVLIRHAQSVWNQQNRFTGWANPPLTEAGLAEARAAAALLLANGYEFDIAYSSRLQRAIQTRDILLASTGQTDIPRFEDWRLNERHYGALQGKDKLEAATSAGEHQVLRWRRGYLDKAAPLRRDDPAHCMHDPAYADVDPALLPDVESLADTRARVMTFWNEQIVPRIKAGERILISAHGNTLRALIMELAGMSVEEVESFEIPTATPIVYQFHNDGTPYRWDYLLPEDGRKRSA